MSPDPPSSLIDRIRFRRDHRWTPAHLSDYVDGELKAGPRSRLQRHVERCPDCNRALVALERLLERLHGVSAETSEETPDIATAVRARL